MAKNPHPEMKRAIKAYGAARGTPLPAFQPVVVDIPYDEDDWKFQFLLQMAKFPNVSRACQAAHVSRVTAYYWKKNSREFSDLWDEICEGATDQLVEKCWNRAMNAFDPGSATLAIFMLKAHRPDVYNPPRVLQASHQYTTKDGEPLTISVTPVNYQNYIAELAPPDADSYADDPEEEQSLDELVRQEALMMDSSRG